MARTLVPLTLLVLLTGCRSTDGGRQDGEAPRGFYTPRSVRGTPPPDAPLYDADGRPVARPIDEQQRRGRARYGLEDQTGDAQDYRQRFSNPPDRYGPTGR